MKKLNSFAQPVGGQGRLQRPIAPVPNQKCSRLILKCTAVATNTAGAPYNFTATDCLSILAQIFGGFNLRFGQASTEQVYQGINFTQLRQLIMYITGRDVRVSSPTATAQPEVAVGSVPNMSIAATGGTRTLVFKVPIPFYVDRLSAQADRWCPGPTQLSLMELWIDQGTVPNINGNTVTIGSTTVDVLEDTITSADPDAWAPVVRPRKVEDAGLEVYAPAEVGALVGALEYTNAAASTTLTAYSLRRGPASEIHDTIFASDTNADYTFQLPIGAADVTAALPAGGAATLLWSMENGSDLEDLPASADKLSFKQVSADLAPPKILWAYAPKVDANYVDMVAKNVSAARQGAPANLVNISALNGRSKSVPGHVSATDPIAIIGNEDPKFQLYPGEMVGPNGTHQPFLPKRVEGQARSEAASGGTAAATVAAKEISKAIPGGRSIVPGGQSATVAAIVKQVS